jgi:gluconolactonase
LIGKLLLPKETANLTFGGKDNNVLFICSSDSIWAITLKTKGATAIRGLAAALHKDR